MAEKKSFNQAAQELGLHPNTLKNYQKAGKLPSAEKVKKPGGGFAWIVDVDEVSQAAKSSARIYEQPSAYYTSDPSATNNNTNDNDFFGSDVGSGSSGRPGNSDAGAGAGAGTVLMALQQERERLMDKVFQLEAQLQDASFERGRLDQLERQIDRMERDRGGLIRAVIVMFVLLVIALLVIATLIFVLKS